MAKQKEVEDHYAQRGYSTHTTAYYNDMRKAKRDDHSHSAPQQRNAEVDAWFDAHCSCTGCCGDSDSEEDLENGSSWCNIL